MEEILSFLPGWVRLIPELFTAAVLLATVLVRLTPTPKDDEVVGKARKLLLDFFQRFPTIGTNPQTKKLKEALKK